MDEGFWDQATTNRTLMITGCWFILTNSDNLNCYFWSAFDVLRVVPMLLVRVTSQALWCWYVQKVFRRQGRREELFVRHGRSCSKCYLPTYLPAKTEQAKSWIKRLSMSETWFKFSFLVVSFIFIFRFACELAVITSQFEVHIKENENKNTTWGNHWLVGGNLGKQSC